MSIWLDEERMPTLQFGGWHTHADLWDRDPKAGLTRMLSYLERIFEGEIVLAETPTIGHGFPFRVVDLCNRDDILEELTSPRNAADMKLLSWSGAQDHLLSDLRKESA